MVWNDRIAVSKKAIAEFCRHWKMTEFALFGSVLRDDFDSGSDLDVLVTFARDAHWSLLDLVRMEYELSDLFGRRVDLVERSAVERSENYIRRRHVLATAEPVYVEG